jgi:protein-L-isoaspartate O-methyltransferase
VEAVPVRRDKGKDTAVPAPFTPGRPRSPEGLIRVLQAEGIRDRRVLAAFGEVPRARFVPPAAGRQASLDEPIRIPHGQVTTQPSLIAKLVAVLGLAGSERVLEVGTGVEQLTPGGRLVHPVGPGGREQVTAFHKEADRLVTDARLTTAFFVPLVGAHGIRSWEGRDGP